MRGFIAPLAFAAVVAGSQGCARLSAEVPAGEALSYPMTYEASVAGFREKLAAVQKLWPEARLESHRLPGDEGLTIDWIWADAAGQKKRLLVLTAGEHGVEAYVGTAVIRLFFEEYLSQLDPKSTGILIVHCINPWGMKHKRRPNRNNVDLNRNFVWDERELDPAFNPDNLGLNALLQPQGRVGGEACTSLCFYTRLLWNWLWKGEGRIRKGTLTGQYRLSQGLYYGGNSIQEETRTLMELYRRHFRNYPRILHLDMHTGYGPPHPLLLITSLAEPRSPAELAKQFRFPGRVEASGDAFYPIRGDMIDYVYRLVREEFPTTHLFAGSFEFGTLGESALAQMRSLRAEVMENRMYWFGATGESARAWVGREFEALNAPPGLTWRRHAAAGTRAAFDGILRVEGLLPSSPPP